MTAPLDTQAAAVRRIHETAVQSGQVPDQTLHQASQAIRTLEWMSKRLELVRALAILFDTFPNAPWTVHDMTEEGDDDRHDNR